MKIDKGVAGCIINKNNKRSITINMINTITKSNGEVVPFDPDKLNRWAAWADRSGADWSTISLDAVSKLQDGCSSQDVNKAIISACMDQFDEASFKLAGRVMAGMIYKEAYGSFKNIPTLSEHINNMVKLGYWEKMDYSEEEVEHLNNILDHSKDLDLNYSEIKQLNDKYLIRDRVKKITKESPQMMYMGMAMANMSNQPKDRRLKDVEKLYHYLSVKAINAPTPFMSYLRTPHHNYASCCVATCNDTIPSLSAADHIYYMMTANSAGIGSHLKTRSAGDPIREGTVEHQGKFGYINAISAMVKANLQGGRGGAATVHLCALDPEIFMMLKLRNVKTPSERRISGVQYSFGYNKLFAKKVKDDKEWLLISYLHAPDLWEAMYSDDEDLFETLYNKYLEKDVPKKIVSAKELAVLSLVQGVETGGVYQENSTEMNKHTPFKDSIYSSNLCVAPETQILTDKGYIPIADLEDETVNVWNGEEFSETVVRKTGVNQKLVRVVTSSGQELECTPYHKFYIFNGYGKPYVEKRANELKSGDKLAKFDLPVISGDVQMDKPYLNGFYTGDGCSFKGKNIVYLYGEKRLLSEEFSKYEHTYYIKQEDQDREVFHMTNLKDKYFVPCENFSIDSRLEWLAGWLDADGCVYRNGDNQQLTGSSVEKEFLLEVQRMLQTLGVSAKLNEATEAGYRKLPMNDGSGGLGDFWCKESWRLLITSCDVYKLMELGLGLYLKRLKVVKKLPQRDAKQFSKVVSVTDEGRFDDTFCLNEPKRHMAMFNGILTGQCKEIALPTKGYDCVTDLYKEEETSGEIGLCNLAAIVAGRVPDEELPELYYYALLMVDNVISLMEYPFPNLSFTAQARRSVAIGLTNLANYMAKNNKKYSTADGKEFIHRVAEKHSYLLHSASLALAKEKGVCDWIDKTKYPEGWLPIDSYNKNVDKIVKQDLLCDWETLRAEIKEVGGIRNSVLEGMMPNESSSIATNGTNSILPVRSLKVVKTNAGNTTKFIAPDYEEFGSNYEIAWNIPSKDLIDVYGIFQKFCGQAISSDLYIDQSKGGKVSESKLLSDWLRMTMLGVKTRYYINTKTASGDKEDKAPEVEELEGDDKGCSSGACTI